MSKIVKTRGKFADEKFLGSEPDLSGEYSQLALIKAYNWFNYFYNSEDAKEFVLSYLRSQKASKTIIKNISRVDSFRLINVGWNCRILSNDGKLPDDILESLWLKIKTLSDGVLPETQSDDALPQKVVISIQERIANKASETIGDLEGEIDEFIMTNKSSFDPVKFMRDNDIKPQIAQRIADYYKKLYAEIFDAIQGKDEQLKEGYSRWKQPKLKLYMEFVKSIVAAAESRIVTVNAVRKPRKKKEKPASVIVAKLNYKIEDTELNIKSVKPTEIVGANQAWTLNTKTRMLSVYNAMGPAGLSVKGSTLIGFDEKTSVVKKLRKPQEQIKALNDAGKVTLRKYMDTVKSIARPAKNRINNDVLLLRIIK